MDELNALLNDAVETTLKMKNVENFHDLESLYSDLRDHIKDFFVSWGPTADEDEVPVCKPLPYELSGRSALYEEIAKSPVEQQE